MNMHKLFAPPQEVVRLLMGTYPFDPYGRNDPTKVLLSCILSARTKDEITYPTADKLFSQYPTVRDLCQAHPTDLENILKPVGFYRQKAKYVRDAACYVEKYGVPKTTKKLTEVPGIGPKCAAIVRAFGWGIPDIAVDTHVLRISKRLGWTEEKDNEMKTQEKLKMLLPIHQWVYVNHLLVSLGRHVCRPQRPLCEQCVLNQKSSICPYPKRP
ncbi:MAG TPA: endonuclease III [Coprothermobacter sp.]|nr:endonuclease III [Coprothermobacter sp.]